MKILWFIPIVPEAALLSQGKEAAGTGFWIHSLARELSHRSDIELAIAYCDYGPSKFFTFDKITLFSIPTVYRKFINLFPPLANYYDMKILSDAQRIIDKYKPDLIHVHGTESIFSLLKKYKNINIPLIISIQGLFALYAKFCWGDRNFLDIVKMQNIRDVFGLFSLIRMPAIYTKLGTLEPTALQSADGVLGRTTWDRSYTNIVACKTPYFHVDELMRQEFYFSKWDISNCQRYRIFTSGRLTLLKGMQVLLEAIALLKNQFPHLSLHIGGSTSNTCEYRHFISLINKLELSTIVHFSGWLPSKKIVTHLQKAHIYVNSSFIENGCNALQEAMLMGIPCVATFTGGMTTTLEHRKTGLMFPPGDSYILADRIRELFQNDHLSEQLGKSASKKAHARHAPLKIVDDLMNAYQSTIH